jgi:hypothetical protein
MRSYDGHGNETVSKRGQAERLPCCQESPTGLCNQHVDNHMAHLQYDKGYEWGWGEYSRARNRAAARMNREMRTSKTPESGDLP